MYMYMYVYVHVHVPKSSVCALCASMIIVKSIFMSNVKLCMCDSTTCRYGVIKINNVIQYSKANGWFGEYLQIYDPPTIFKYHQ